MAAASGENDGFPLGPQLFCRFAGARVPATQGVPLIFVYVHKEFVLFCVHDLFFIAFNKFLSII